MIIEVQRELQLPICPNIFETQKRLHSGIFRATSIQRRSGDVYNMDFGSFDPPATITLDSRIPFCDKPLNMPQLPPTLAHYTATHEVIHADDHTGDDRVFKATCEHILSDHYDKLEKGMLLIEKEGGCDSIRSFEDLALYWAMQYVDMLTHYRAFIILRHKNFPKLDMIWSLLRNDLFPPSLLTGIEREKNTRYIFESIIGRAGEYCIIDALKESASISKRNADRYAV